MALDFRILGPLEVADDDVVLRLGGRMERTVLAALLLHAGRVVPVEQLVDDLYGDAAPATAVSQVRDHVSQLRKRFGRKSAILETRAPGYVLRVEPLQLDTVRFERAVEAAVAALGDGRADEARRRLRDALAMWRGPALADFAGAEFAQTEIRRLDQLRLAATEQRVAADFAVGDDASLVPELQTLVRAHPFRERLRAQLMLALYDAGRQAARWRRFTRLARTSSRNSGSSRRRSCASC
jgi:DNA-binding SARP family transcriptional activator